MSSLSPEPPLPAAAVTRVPRGAAPTAGSTAERTLDVAERLVQVRGFNGFSYADVARELGITKASLHYHFPGKAELGEALIARYSDRFADALAHIDAEGADPASKLGAYVEIYSGVLAGHRLCLCGILAAEYATLPPAMRERVVAFFAQSETWLAGVLRQGEEDGSLELAAPPEAVAQMLLGALEGAMLLARTSGGVEQFRACAGRLLGTLRP